MTDSGAHAHTALGTIIDLLREKQIHRLLVNMDRLMGDHQHFIEGWTKLLEKSLASCNSQGELLPSDKKKLEIDTWTKFGRIPMVGQLEGCNENHSIRWCYLTFIDKVIMTVLSLG